MKIKMIVGLLLLLVGCNTVKEVPENTRFSDLPFPTDATEKEVGMREDDLVYNSYNTNANVNEVVDIYTDYFNTWVYLDAERDGNDTKFGFYKHGSLHNDVIVFRVIPFEDSHIVVLIYSDNPEKVVPAY